MSVADELGLTEPTKEEGVPVPPEQAPEFLNQFVGEDKKYKDVEALAKAYYNMEQHSNIVKQENEAYREEIGTLKTKEKTVDEIMTAFSSQEEAGQPVQAPSEVDISSVVAEELTRREREMRLEEVKLRSKEALVEAFGEDSLALVNKYTNGDETKDNIIRTLASTDPTGLVNLLKGVQGETPTVIQTTETGSANFRADVGGLGLSWSDAQKVRKDNPVLYKSHAFQSKLHNAANKAAALNIDYYNT